MPGGGILVYGFIQDYRFYRINNVPNRHSALNLQLPGFSCVPDKQILISPRRRSRKKNSQYPAQERNRDCYPLSEDDALLSFRKYWKILITFIICDISATTVVQLVTKWLFDGFHTKSKQVRPGAILLLRFEVRRASTLAPD